MFALSTIDAWIPTVNAMIALLVGLLAFARTVYNSRRAAKIQADVVDVKRATGTNRRDGDEALDPVKPEPEGAIGSPQRRHTDNGVT